MLGACPLISHVAEGDDLMTYAAGGGNLMGLYSGSGSSSSCCRSSSGSSSSTGAFSETGLMSVGTGSSVVGMPGYSHGSSSGCSQPGSSQLLLPLLHEPLPLLGRLPAGLEDGVMLEGSGALKANGAWAEGISSSSLIVA